MATASGPVLRIVDAKAAERHLGRYAARIRWTCVADTDWEIDTRHTGFETWRQAACFANGLSEDGASGLFLHDGALILQLVDGRDTPVENHAAVIWQRTNSIDSALPVDLSFIRAALGPRELSEMGLDGAFSPLRFGVDDLRGSARLDVRVEADARRRTVLVTLAVPKEDEDPRGDAFGGALFDVPQA